MLISPWAWVVGGTIWWLQYKDNQYQVRLHKGYAHANKVENAGRDFDNKECEFFLKQECEASYTKHPYDRDPFEHCRKIGRECNDLKQVMESSVYDNQPHGIWGMDMGKKLVKAVQMIVGWCGKQFTRLWNGVLNYLSIFKIQKLPWVHISKFSYVFVTYRGLKFICDVTPFFLTCSYPSSFRSSIRPPQPSYCRIMHLIILVWSL